MHDCEAARWDLPRCSVNEQRKRVSLQPINFSRLVTCRLDNASGRLCGIDQRLPGHWGSKDWNTKVELVAVRIHHYEKAFVDIALAAWGEELAGPAAQDIAEGQPCRIFPVLARRFLAQRSDPANVFDPTLPHYPPTPTPRPRNHPLPPRALHHTL